MGRSSSLKATWPSLGRQRPNPRLTYLHFNATNNNDHISSKNSPRGRALESITA